MAKISPKDFQFKKKKPHLSAFEINELVIFCREIIPYDPVRTAQLVPTLIIIIAAAPRITLKINQGLRFIKPKTKVKTNRKQAIKTACQLAQANDIILIAGKGHETYQEIQGVRHDFDDMKTIKELLEQLNK